MGILDQQAEERIRAAMARGEFAHLPGEGLPLAFEDERLVPEEVRMVHHVLRNAGCLPPQILAMKEATEVADQATRIADGRVRDNALSRLNLLLTSLAAQGQRHMAENVLAQYRQKLLAKLSR